MTLDGNFYTFTWGPFVFEVEADWKHSILSHISCVRDQTCDHRCVCIHVCDLFAAFSYFFLVDYSLIQLYFIGYLIIIIYILHLHGSLLIDFPDQITQFLKFYSNVFALITGFLQIYKYIMGWLKPIGGGGGGGGGGYCIG